MSNVHSYQFALALFKGARNKTGQAELSGFLGSATIINGRVCTCKHVVEAVDFSKEVILTAWDHQEMWAMFTNAIVHPKYDFAILEPRHPLPFASLPLYEDPLPTGARVYTVGFHDDGVIPTIGEGKNFQVASRTFYGNVVRIWETQSNKSPSICEISFPTHSGFSGAPLVDRTFRAIFGMVYGNLEQSIQLYSKTEVLENEVQFSEIVSRIIELGLFHRAQDIKRFLAELGELDIQPES